MSFKPYTEKIKKKKMEFVDFRSDPDPDPGPVLESSRKRIRIRIKMIRIRNTGMNFEQWSLHWLTSYLQNKLYTNKIWEKGSFVLMFYSDGNKYFETLLNTNSP